MTRRQRLLVAVPTALAVLAGALAGSVSSASAAQTPDPVPTAAPAAGAFYPVAVQRLLGAGRAGALPTAGRAISAVRGLHVPVLGRDGLPPTGVSAVVVNVTATAGASPITLRAQPATGPLSAGFPEAMSAGTPRGTTALTAPAGRTRTGLATVPLDPDGAFDLTVLGGAATVTVDLVGLYAADDTVVAMLGTTGGYQPLDPIRLLGSGVVAPTFPSGPVGPSVSSSTSTPSPFSQVGGGPDSEVLPQSAATVDPSLSAAVAARSTRRLAVDVGTGVTEHVTALLLRVSAAGASAVGAVSVTGPPAASAPVSEVTDAPSDASTPAPSAYAVPTLTLDPGVAASNLAIVPAVRSGDGSLAVDVTNSSTAATDVRVDLVGFFDDSGLGPDLRFRSLPPSRVADTRSGLGLSPLTAGERTDLRLSAEVVGDNTFALVGTLTVTSSSPATDIHLGRSASGPDDVRVAGGSGDSVPLMVDDQLSTPVVPEVTAAGVLPVTSSTGPAQLVLDVVGSFEAYPAVSDPSTRGWVPVVAPWQVTASAR